MNSEIPSGVLSILTNTGVMIMSMVDISSERRMVENEAFFRQANSTVVQGLKDLKELSDAEKSNYPLPDLDMPISFFCECSDENCRTRIKTTPSFYEEVHKDSSHFIICHGHEVLEIERIVKTEQDFVVVEKFITPPNVVEKLHKTDVENV